MCEVVLVRAQGLKKDVKKKPVILMLPGSGNVLLVRYGWVMVSVVCERWLFNFTGAQRKEKKRKEKSVYSYVAR